MTISASIPVRRDTPADAGSVDTSAFPGMAAVGLLVVVGVFIWALWRKRQQAAVSGTGAARITTLTRTHLTPRHTLHEVHWQGMRLLIGCAENSIVLLKQVPLDPIEAPPHQTPASQEKAGASSDL